MTRIMAATVWTWRSAATLLTLGAIVALALLLALRPLRVDSPASASARALLRLDNALGATVEPIDPSTAGMLGLQSNGGYLVITSVASNGPAATAGLRVGDVIEQIDGRPAAMLDLAELASATPVSILRDGKESVVNVQFAGGASS